MIITVPYKVGMYKDTTDFWKIPFTRQEGKDVFDSANGTINNVELFTPEKTN